MLQVRARASIKLLFIGPISLFNQIKSYAPSEWELFHSDTIKNFLNAVSEINVILDASINEPIDLSCKEFSKVKFVCTASTGTNHILIPINKVSDVRVISLKEIPETLNQLTSAAEFSFGLLIALVRNVVPAVKSVELGNWNRLEFPGMILNGKNLGVIGFGRIGRAMASYAKCFGLNVGYYDPYIDGQSIEFQKFASINELVSISDIVSLHVPYDSARSEIPILSRENFLFFKQGSFFINTSRGELIDEDGLIYAIQSGVIKGVALDVIRNEPNVVNNKIFKFAKTTNANVIFTPHIAGYATENVAIAALGMLNYLKLLFNQDVHE